MHYFMVAPSVLGMSKAICKNKGLWLHFVGLQSLINEEKTKVVIGSRILMRLQT